MANKQTIAQTKYDSTHCRTYGLKLNYGTDADIIEKLASVPSMQGYIKQLIRQDIAGSVLTPATGSVPVSVPKTDCVSCFVPGKQDLPSISDKVNCLIKVASDAGIEKELLEELKKL